LTNLYTLNPLFLTSKTHYHDYKQQRYSLYPVQWLNIQENNTLITYLSSFNDIIYTPEKCQKLLDDDTLDIALVLANRFVTNDRIRLKIMDVKI
jgi:hypothetical protein